MFLTDLIKPVPSIRASLLPAKAGSVRHGPQARGLMSWVAPKAVYIERSRRCELGGAYMAGFAMYVI